MTEDIKPSFLKMSLCLKQEQLSANGVRRENNFSDPSVSLTCCRGNKIQKILQLISIVHVSRVAEEI